MPMDQKNQQGKIFLELFVFFRHSSTPPGQKLSLKRGLLFERPQYIGEYTLHKLFSGVVAQDLCGVIKILSSKGWFTLQEYNQALMKRSFKSYERNDKPLAIKNPKARKLQGKAVSIWTHIRCFGMVIEAFVEDVEDNVLECSSLK